MKEILERWSEPTPKFWQKIRKYGIILGVIGGVIATAPISFPATIVTIAGYLVTIGTVTTVLAQTTSNLR